MADTPKVYVLCDSNCKYEGMTKEQILAAIAQTISTGEIGECDTGFITTIKTINGLGLKFFLGEQAEYDALTEDQKQNLFAIITNDTTREELLKALEELKKQASDATNSVQAIEKGLNDASIAGNAQAVAWLKGGAQKDDFNFISDNGTWAPDPCGNYWSNTETTITTSLGETETIKGWRLNGEWIKDDKYIQFLKTGDKIFMRELDKVDGIRTAKPFTQIAGEGTRVTKAGHAENADNATNATNDSNGRPFIANYAQTTSFTQSDTAITAPYGSIFIFCDVVRDIDTSNESNAYDLSNKYSIGDTIKNPTVTVGKRLFSNASGKTLTGTWRVCGYLGWDHYISSDYTEATAKYTHNFAYLIQRVWHFDS